MTKAEFEKKYKIIKKLAEGGQGEVFLAQIQNEDLGFVREVAIKFLHKNSSTRETVLNEIKILTILRHPNICQILDVGEFEERYFVVLEYVDGVSLKTFKESLVKKGLKINDGALLEIASGCLSALKYAHHLREGKVLHHDISPHNMMITSSGHLKLIDFGIAQIFNGVQDSKIQGKPAYLPSSVLNGDEKYSARSEMYSLGIVLMELMFGRRLEEKALKQKLESSSHVAQALISSLINFDDNYDKLEKFIKRESVSFESNFSELVKKCTDDQYIADNTLVDAETYYEGSITKSKKGIQSSLFVVVVISISFCVAWFSYRPNEYDKTFEFVSIFADGQERQYFPPKEFLNSSERNEPKFSGDSCEMSCMQASVNLTLGHKVSIEKMKTNGVLEEEYKKNVKALHNHTLNLYRKTFDNIQKNIRMCSMGGRVCGLTMKLSDFMAKRLSPDLSAKEFKETYLSLMNGNEEIFNDIVRAINNGGTIPKKTIPQSKEIEALPSSPFVVIKIAEEINQKDCLQVGDFQYLTRNMFQNNFYDKEISSDANFLISNSEIAMSYDVSRNPYPVLNFVHSGEDHKTISFCSYVRKNGILKYLKIWHIDLP